jgi:Fe2+ transport system protein FeoA
VTSPRPVPVPLALARVPAGVAVRVVAVDPAHAGELARDGLLPGVVLAVASRTPLGGPVVVTLGRARLAVSADIAAAIVTVPLA